jgi:hypothetical protein
MLKINFYSFSTGKSGQKSAVFSIVSFQWYNILIHYFRKDDFRLFVLLAHPILTTLLLKLFITLKVQ